MVKQDIEIWKEKRYFLPLYLANDLAFIEVELLVFVEAAIVDRIIVSLSQKFEVSFCIILLSNDSVDDWDVLTLKLVHYNITVLNWGVLGQEEDVASLHFRLHRPGEHDNDGALRPENELHHVPNHDCARDDQVKLQTLVDQLNRSVLTVRLIAEYRVSEMYLRIAASLP